MKPNWDCDWISHIISEALIVGKYYRRVNASWGNQRRFCRECVYKVDNSWMLFNKIIIIIIITSNNLMSGIC